MGDFVKIFKNLFAVLAYFWNPEVRKKRDRESTFNQVKKLEDDYNKALLDGDPVLATVIDAKLRRLREKIRYVRAD